MVLALKVCLLVGNLYSLSSVTLVVTYPSTKFILAAVGVDFWVPNWAVRSLSFFLAAS